ncbi:MAG TPA: DciA family protein [Terriglobales bacterium]
MESIRSGLRRVIHDLLATQPHEEAAVVAWPLVCGKEVAARTKVVCLAQGRLTVEVPDATWCAQLAAFTPRYISSYGELIGPVVRELKFRAAIGR